MTTITNKKLAEMDAWAIAEHFNLGYSGDMNVIEHGGYFYNLRSWEEYGYASCVEFWWDHDRDAVVVECGTINKPSDLADCFRTCGWEIAGDQVICSHDKSVVGPLTPDIEIECVHGHWGFDRGATQTFPELEWNICANCSAQLTDEEVDGDECPYCNGIKDWEEFVWENVRGWLKRMGEEA